MNSELREQWKGLCSLNAIHMTDLRVLPLSLFFFSFTAFTQLQFPFSIFLFSVLAKLAEGWGCPQPPVSCMVASSSWTQVPGPSVPEVGVEGAQAWPGAGRLLSYS